MSDFCRYLDWDSGFFGLRIARVAAESLNENTIREMESWARSERIDCLYLLANLEGPSLIRAAEENGFHLADVRVTLEISLRAGTSAPEAVPENVRPCREEDLPALMRLAQTQHHLTRFFRDSRFPRDKAEELYSLWIENAWSTPATRIFTVDLEGRPAGYVACEMATPDAGRISLAGVDAAHRGKGVATSLVQAAQQWFRSNGATRSSVVTQGANIPALRLYTSNGFYPVQTELWYHRWLT